MPHTLPQNLARVIAFNRRRQRTQNKKRFLRELGALCGST